MELSTHEVNNNCPKGVEVTMASISDLSSVLTEKEPFETLMSSLRSLVDVEDLDLFDGLDDSFVSLDDSMKDLLSEVNDLLHSKATFTLSESTSLETEMMRLKRLRKRKTQQENSKPTNTLASPSDAFSCIPMIYLNSNAVQKQKEKLAHVLKDALGQSEESFLGSPKPISTLSPLNPNRFDSSPCDSAPKSPSKRGRSPYRTPLAVKSLPFPPALDDLKSPVKRWDSESVSPQKRGDAPPKSPRKRTASPFTGGPVITLAVMPNLDIPAAPVSPSSSSSENDEAPKKPMRMHSGCCELLV